jgi:hypothetical protein
MIMELFKNIYVVENKWLIAIIVFINTAEPESLLK